jgi:carboxyl-terminal processing protease
MKTKGLWGKARSKRAISTVGIVAGVVVIFGLGVLVGDGRLRLARPAQYKDQTGLPTALNYQNLNQIYDALRKNYDGKLSESQVLDGLKHGLADSTGDPYTQFFSAKEAQSFNSDLQGITLSGIGAQLDQDTNKNIVVVAPLGGSPAEAAGVKAKDIIATINGESTAGMSLGTAVGKIRGPKGSKVTLGIVRGDQALTVTITRDTINVPTATTKILDGNIGYIQVSQFSNDTFGLVQDGVKKFQQAGVQKVVLDLRNDPGGEVDSAQNIASLWLPDNAVIMRAKRGSEVIETDRATGKNPLKGMQTVVLINGGSASASEITALALHDNKAAITMGEKSFGKGVMQQVIPFDDGSELKVTIAKWYSPGDTNVNHKGITPDQSVAPGNDPTNDLQLLAAEAYLNK